MGSDPVVVLPPTFDDNTDFLQIQEELSVHTLISKTGICTVAPINHLLTAFASANMPLIYTAFSPVG